VCEAVIDPLGPASTDDPTVQIAVVGFHDPSNRPVTIRPSWRGAAG
jgi:hypothetical protein